MSDAPDQLCIDTIRFLSVDAVQEANSDDTQGSDGGGWSAAGRKLRFGVREHARRGASVLSDAKACQPELILVASGSEVSLILAAAERLQGERIAVHCVSMPSWDLFGAQSQTCSDEVLPPDGPARLAVELGVAQGWHRYIGDHGEMLGVERFGASAPADILLRECGFTVENVVLRARKLLAGPGDAHGA